MKNQFWMNFGKIFLMPNYAFKKQKEWHKINVYKYSIHVSDESISSICIKVDENRVLHIFSVIMLRRSDKQPDRVEISPEQLSDASSKAEVIIILMECRPTLLSKFFSMFSF